jgi:flagellar assembly protein FliH
LSNIYTSDGVKKGNISELDLGINRLGPQEKGLPAGGFIGITGEHEDREAPTEFIARKQREAEALVEQARREAESIQRDAYQAGFEQGEKAGEKLALQKIEPVIDTFEQLIRNIGGDREQLIKRHEQDLIKIAFLIATQVVRETIQQDPQTIARVVSAAMLKVNRTQKLLLRVNAMDRTLLEKYFEAHADGDWLARHVVIEVDDTVGRGGCRLETETGNVDATIETQLAVLKNTLWDDAI